MTPMEAYNDLIERCVQVHIITREPDDDRDDNSTAVGAIVQCIGAGFLMVEIGQAGDGESFVIAKAFTDDGVQRRVSVIEMDDTAMVTLSLDTRTGKD